MVKFPEWSMALRHEMLTYGINGAEIARRLQKSPQWVSNVMTGLRVNASMQAAIIACVDEIIEERQRKETA